MPPICAAHVMIAGWLLASWQESVTRKKKLLSLTPFLSLQQAVNVCRSEKSARANERSLSHQAGVAAVQTHHKNGSTSSGTSFCRVCGCFKHKGGGAKFAPYIGKCCHICGKVNHFAPQFQDKKAKKLAEEIQTGRTAVGEPIARCNASISAVYRRNIATYRLRWFIWIS